MARSPSDRHRCATCIHIAHVSTRSGSYFRCERLGWRTEPRYRFDCWVERSRQEKMRRLDETEDPGTVEP